MKRIFLCFVLLLGACTTVQQQTAQQALAKLNADVQNGCLVVQPTLASIQVIDPSIAPLVAANGALCAANATINVSSISTIINTGIPAVEAAVQSSAIIPANQKPVIVGALTAFQIALSTALVVYNQSAPAAVATPTVGAPA